MNLKTFCFKRTIPSIFLFLVLIFGYIGNAQAQIDIDSFSSLLKQQQNNLILIENNLKALQQRYNIEQNDKTSINEIGNKATEINEQIIAIALLFRNPLINFNLRLDQLGDSDEPDESKDVIAERNLIRQNKAKLNTFMDDLEEKSINTNLIIEQINKQSRALFTQSLTQRVYFNKALVIKIIEGSKQALVKFKNLIIDWWELVFKAKKMAFLISFLSATLFSLIVAFFSFKLVKRIKAGVVRKKDNVSYLTRFSTAFALSLLPSLVCVVFALTMLVLLNHFGLLNTPLKPAFHAAFDSFYMLIFIICMTYAILSPNNPKMRLLNIATNAGNRLFFFLTALVFLGCLDYFLGVAYHIVAASSLVSLATSFIIVFMMGILILIIANLHQVSSKKSEKKISIWPFYIRIILCFIGLTMIAIDLLGYVGLAHYITQQILVIGSYLVLIFLGFEIARFLAKDDEFAKTSIGKGLIKRFEFEEDTMDLLGLFISVLIIILVFLIAIPSIAIQLGFSFSQIFTTAIIIFTGFQIGNVSISFVNILTGIAFFILCWFLLSWFISWLDGTVLRRSGVDSGVRNSIRTIIGYGAVAISALIGLSAAGFNLSSLALIAGGLSLGIGFGMQNIVQNFVSGLILLAERPFKVGDYIETGDTTGYVKRISVRATEVETSQWETVIVPNSNLINNNVGNWTHRNRTGRLDIDITVPAMAHPEHIVAALMEIVSKNDEILREPAPSVSFEGFDSNVLKFVLNVYVPDITSTTDLANNIRFTVYKRFSDEGMI